MPDPDTLRPAIPQIVKLTQELSLLYGSNQASFRWQPTGKPFSVFFRCALNSMLLLSVNIRNTLFLESFYTKFERHYADSILGRDADDLQWRDGGLVPAVGQKPRPRIESLTDLVFGPTLSIGAVGPISNRPKNTEIRVERIVGFGFSFLILISIWFRYTEVMSILRVDIPRTPTPNTTHPPS